MLSQAQNALADAKDRIEQTVESGREPPAGQQGAGTVDSPYDAGNAPEQSESTTEPPSGQQGAGTLDSPYDGGNAPENPPQSSTLPTHPAQPSISIQTDSPSTADQGTALPLQEPSPAQATKAQELSKQAEEAQENKTSAGLEISQNSTGVAAEGGNFDASKKGAGREARRLRSIDREVSPGTRSDGTHATTSGDRGESYVPPGKFGKLKGKLGLSSSK